MRKHVSSSHNASELGDGKLVAIVESLKEGLLVVNAEGIIEFINSAAKRLLCLNVNVPVGRLVEEVVWVAAIQRYILETSHGGSSNEDEAIIDTPEGERNVHLYGARIEGQQGSNSSMLFVITDTTQLKNLEQMRRDFVANVSHELKTPITVIQGFVETLLDGEHTPDDSKRFLSSIARQTDRLSHLFDDVLSLSKLEQERSKILLTHHTLLPLLSAIIQSHERQAAEKGINITLTCREDVAALVNLNLFEQAIVNLLQNAIEYTSTGGSINILASESGGRCEVKVRDSGCGIETEHLTRIFERFYRIDQGRSRKSGGTGLGLAIVKHIAHIHGGSVSVSSIPNQGSEFVLGIKSV